MKLFEIRKRYRNDQSSLISFATFEQNGFDEFEVEVIYDYVPASHSDHPYGEGTAREHHASTMDIIDIVTTKEVNQYDEDGVNVIKKWPKGSDVTKFPGWKAVEKFNMNHYESQIHDKLSNES